MVIDIFRYILTHKLEIIIIFGILLLVSLGIMGFEFRDIENSRRFIYSTLVSGLFATFAIVFSLSIVAIQQTTKYSPKLYQQFFRIGTICYISLFLVSISFSLVGLLNLKNIHILNISLEMIGINTNNEFFLKMSLMLTAICMISLILYWRYLKYKMDPIVFLIT
jgi:hypothetical protein